MVKYLALFLIMAFFSGCSTSHDLFKKEIPTRAPEEDFRLLAKFLSRYGGNQYLAENSLDVEWRDTLFYRIFEFSGMTVILYPWDWTSSRYDMRMFLGTFDDVVDFRDMRPRYIPVPEGPRWVLSEHLEINTISSAGGIGFGPFILGGEKVDVLTNYERDLMASVVDDGNRSQALRMIRFDHNFTDFSQWEETRRKQGLKFVRRDGMAIYSGIGDEEKVVYLSINNVGMPYLGGFGWVGLERLGVTVRGHFYWDPSEALD